MMARVDAETPNQGLLVHMAMDWSSQMWWSLSPYAVGSGLCTAGTGGLNRWADHGASGYFVGHMLNSFFSCPRPSPTDVDPCIPAILVGELFIISH